MRFDKVILRCHINLEMVDRFVDALLAYPQQDLKMISYQVQSHHHALTDIREKVSGFKQQQVFEVTLKATELTALKTYLNNLFVGVNLEAQVIPLLDDPFLS